VTANVSYPSYYSSAGDIVIIIDTYDDPNYPQRITKTFGTLRQKITYLREAIEKPKAKGSRSLAKKKSATDGKKKSATDGK
jgi:Zn-dependent M32 family carboxypeptidase